MAIAPVVPNDLSRAKRIAKRLHEIYPSHPLSECQATTAHLFGHKDWHAIEQAINNRARSAPFDDDISNDELDVRWGTQQEIVCRELGGVDITGNHDRPEEPQHKSSMTEAELNAHLARSRAQVPLRLEKALARLNILLAVEAIYEIQPTRINAPPAAPYPKVLTLYEPEQLAAMPAALGRWWALNISHQPVVAEALKAYQLDPHNAVSLICFGAYWGQLCVHYAETINWTMGMGVAFLLAERYGSIWAQDSPEGEKAVLAAQNGRPRVEIQEALTGMERVCELSTLRFLDGYPRDDFGPGYHSQPDAFRRNAKEVIKILATPKSRKGIWKHAR